MQCEVMARLQENPNPDLENALCSYPLPLWEGTKGRGKHFDYPFTLTLTLSHQGRGDFEEFYVCF